MIVFEVYIIFLTINVWVI